MTFSLVHKDDNTTSVSSGTTATTTWPTVSAGDLAVLDYFCRSTTTLPSGFSLANETLNNSNSQRTGIAYKVCDGSETGTITLTQASSGRAGVHLTVYRSSTGSIAFSQADGTGNLDLSPAKDADILSEAEPFLAHACASDVFTPSGQTYLEPRLDTDTARAEWTALQTAGGQDRLGSAYAFLDNESTNVCAFEKIDGGTSKGAICIATFVEDGAADTTAPTLTSATDTSTGTTTGDGSVSTDEDNGTLYWVVTQSSTTPSVAQIQAGQDHTGSAADDSGSQSVSATGAQAVSASGLSSSTTYYFHFQHQDTAGNDSTAISADGFTTDASDVTAPVLTSPTAVATGTTTADLGVDADEAGGTLYWVVTQSATAPSVAQVQAGQDHTGSAADANNSASISGTGTQSVSATGLSSGNTYYAHFQADDASGNDSTVVTSASFEVGVETTGSSDDFDSALGTIGTITDPYGQTPTVPLVPYDPGEVTGWLNIYVRVSGVDTKTPTFTLDFSDFRETQAPDDPDWQMVWRYVNDTDPSTGRIRAWNAFDNGFGGNNSGDSYVHTFYNNSAFTSDDIEIAIKPRFRYLDTQHAIAYAAASSYGAQLPSCNSSHYHDQITITSGANSAAGATLNLYGILLDDTTSQPAGGEDKLNIVLIPGQHSSEDQGNLLAWEIVKRYIDGGTSDDWFRQHCRLFVYDANPAGRYYGKERYTEESAGDEDPNRAWDDTGSEQINAVKAAIVTDLASYGNRMDVMYDCHGAYSLNGNPRPAEFGIYDDNSTAAGNYKSREAAAMVAAETNDAQGATYIIRLGDNPTGSAGHYASSVWSAQLPLTPENPIAAEGFPDSQAMYYDRRAAWFRTALENMVANSELTLTGATTLVAAFASRANNLL